MSSRAVLFTVIAVAAFVVRAHGDPPKNITKEERSQFGPGFFHRGRYIGYVPAHLKHRARSTPVATSSADLPSTERATRQASYTEEIEPPQPLELPETEFLVDDSPCCDQPVCCQPSRFWGRAEYLLWWTSGMDVPPLAATGVFGQPGTAVLFGDDGLNDGIRSGGRFTVGAWLDGSACRAVEVNHLILDGETESFAASQNDLPVLVRPFFNAQTNVQDARQIATPGVVSGNLNIQAETDMYAFETLYRFAAMQTPGQRIDCLLGYRFVELEDDLVIRESTLALAGPLMGTTFDLRDQFSTRNTFHGGEIGMVVTTPSTDCWSWEVVGKVALGTTNSRVSLVGETVTTTGGVAATTPAGLLVQGTNRGTFEQSNFSAVTEFGVILRRDFDSGLSASFGYTLLHWMNVARAGDQIDPGINPTQIPPGMLVGSARPAFPFDTTDFVAQGLRFGLEYAW